MTSLRQLLLGAYPELVPESLPDIPVRGIEVDSRKVEEGFVFIAIRGAKADGAEFAAEAARRGACAVVGETKPKDSTLPFIKIDDSREAASRLAASFYGNPSKKMKMAGVTGTNGKTTVTYLVEHLLRKKGIRAGAIGTVSYRYAGVEMPALETTPGPLKLQKILSEMAQAGCQAVVMEVSSHALDQGRVGGIEFEGAAFTNLTQDHLDYHKTMEAYFESKAKLFRGLSKDASAVINTDDEWGKKLAPLTKARLVAVGMGHGTSLKAEDLVHESDSTRFDLVRGGQRYPVSLPLIGRHNVENALVALGLAETLGVPVEEGLRFLSDFPGVPGRLEAVRGGQDFTVLVDFAHTPDGLENVLRALSEHKTRRLLVVFGCGGDRDKTKRPKMAEIVSRWADHVYVTSDNPRSEDPRAIAGDICAGFPADFKHQSVVLDRKKAIRQALLAARTGDIVLLAGKGHERAQIVGNQSLPFSDREEAERVLNGR